MTDDSCGCSCRDCVEQDIHNCGLATCGYTKYRHMTKPATMRPASEGFDLVRAKFRSIPDPKVKARLREWAAFVSETAGMEQELRDLKRREKYAEIFG